jgi:drug/metabolite transporter (DMT)-like permease
VSSVVTNETKALLLALLCAVCISTGQVLWKIAIDRNGGLIKQGLPLLRNFWGLFTSPFMLIGLFVYLISMGIWMYVLGEYEFSYVYPMVSLVFVFGFAYSKFLFHERINIYRWIGVAMIIAGVIIINRKG